MKDRPDRPALDEVIWDRWEEVDALLDFAMDLPRDELEDRLLERCDGDSSLADAVSRLLAAAEQDPDETTSFAGATLRAALENREREVTPSIGPGDRVGRYRLVRELGRGGMAVVYEAHRADGAFERSVALKVLRTELSGSEFVERSLAERQILAELDHRNIARLLDGGTTEHGRPFLVMELVEGLSITEWAKEASASVEDRVRLFLQVVDAVSYAHQHLIVHRDLKPSNVLVTTDGESRLLDFGVAKLLAPDAQAEDPITRAHPAPFTPEFASPEQLRGDRITAASDVFQLGALLHQLLTGERPFKGSLRARLAGEELDSPRPSDSVADPRLAGELRGDLDIIVVKALEHDPARRYPSAEALALDLGNYLEGRPISAQPASAWVRARKFGRRNPWFWPVAAAVTVGLAGYIGTVTNYARRLENERTETLLQAERARAFQAFVLNQFGAADPYSGAQVSPDVSLVDALTHSAQAAREQLADDPILQAEMLSSVARVYDNLDLRAEAREMLDEAMGLRSTHGATESLEQVADMGLLGSVLGRLGENDSATVLLTHRLEKERQLHSGPHLRVADALDRLGWHEFELALYPRALERYEEAVQIRRSVDPPDYGALSASLSQLADSYRAVNRWEEALRAATDAHEVALTHFGARDLATATAKGHLAQVVHGMEDLDRAETLYRQMLPILEEKLGPEHETTMANWNNLALVLDGAGDYQAAEAAHRRILEIRLRRFGTRQHVDVGRSLQNLAAVLTRQGRYLEAGDLASEAEGIFAGHFGDGHFSVAFALITHAETWLQLGDGAQAEPLARRAETILFETFGEGYPTSAARCRVGRALHLRGFDEESKRVMSSALEVMDGVEGVPAREVSLCSSALAAISASPTGSSQP